MVDPRKVMQYSDKILEIIDEQADPKNAMTRGDLQGVVEALVIRILSEKNA